MKQPVIFVSDSTGITVESLGASLLAQFEGVHFDVTLFRFIDSLEKVDQVLERIAAISDAQSRRPIVISTLVDGGLRARLQQAQAHVFDLMGEFLTPLEEILHVQASPHIGVTHGQRQEAEYQRRMDAVNFALLNDDGATTRHYDQAQVILVGLSRSGKPPTCVYLDMQYGI